MISRAFAQNLAVIGMLQALANVDAERDWCNDHHGFDQGCGCIDDCANCAYEALGALGDER